MTTETIWTDPDRKEWRSLPRTWNGTTNITERWALAHGWSFREEEVPDPVPVFIYSKYRLHLTLGMQDLWDSFWNALSADEKQLWADANELRSDDPFFMGAMARLKEILKIDEDLLEQILEESQI